MALKLEFRHDCQLRRFLALCRCLWQAGRALPALAGRLSTALPRALNALPILLGPPCRNLGCANTACNLCKLSQRRRCPTNFAAKYLAPCDVVEAKCGAQIYVVVVDEKTGQLVQQGLEELAILVRGGEPGGSVAAEAAARTLAGSLPAVQHAAPVSAARRSNVAAAVSEVSARLSSLQRCLCVFRRCLRACPVPTWGLLRLLYRVDLHHRRSQV